MKTALAALAVAGLAVAGCAMNDYEPAYAANDGASYASAAASTGTNCFRTSQITGQRIIDNDTVLFEVGNRVIQVELSNACLAGARSDPLVIGVRGGSGLICRAIDLDLKSSVAGTYAPCIVSRIDELTPSQAAALPPEQRP